MSKSLLARFAHSPVMIAADKADWLQANLEAMAEHEDFGKVMAAAEDDNFWPDDGDWMSMFRPYKVVGGVLQIPVRGTLMHNFGYQFLSYATGYEYIERAFVRGMADPSVQGIAFVIDSNGGEVAGNFDMVDRMYAAKGAKPVTAVLNEHAYSAAYSIASLADTIYVPRTGGAGSIGVVTAHVDLSEAMEQNGVKITFIHAGKYKVEGNPYEPLSDEAKNRMQVRIEGLYNIFVSTVARNRGLEEQAVRDTEALTFSAEEAVANGLADVVMSPSEALALFANELKEPSAGATTMTIENHDTQASLSQEDLTAARAEGATAERERIQGILACDEAASRPALANHLALNTDLSVEAAKGILAATPAEATTVQAEGTNPFDAAMNGTENPNLGVENTAEEAETDPANELLSAYKIATGMAK